MLINYSKFSLRVSMITVGAVLCIASIAFILLFAKHIVDLANPKTAEIMPFKGHKGLHKQLKNESDEETEGSADMELASNTSDDRPTSKKRPMTSPTKTDEKPPTPVPRKLSIVKRMVTIKNKDMSDDMAEDALALSKEAVAKYAMEKDIAKHLKSTFDTRYGPTWQCIVGRNYGSYVTHETQNFIYFYIDKLAILLYKMG